MCTYCNYRFVTTKVCCDFWECSTSFIIDELIFLFVALVELLGLWVLLYYLWHFDCLWVACWAWVGTKVLVHYGHEWARECLSLNGMCEGWWLFDPFSIGTLTCVKLIETVLEWPCHRTRAIHNSGLFLLIWCGWLGYVCISSNHLIK
jgi:hypothetical protein